MEPGVKSSVADRVEEFGFVVSAVMGLLTAVAPLFGTSGLVYVVPMPEGFARIGPPLATLVSLLVALAVLVFFASRIADRGPWIGAAACFVGGLLLLGIYLSWIEDGQVSGTAPVMLLAGGVVTVFVFVAGIAALASTFAFLCAAFLQRQDASVASPVRAEEQRVEEQEGGTASERTGGENRDRSVAFLHRLVTRAEWPWINEAARDGPRVGFWRLYYHLSTLLISPESMERTRSLVRARLWFRVLSLVTKTLPGSGNPARQQRRFLGENAGLLIRAEREKARIQAEINELGFAPDVELLTLLQRGFLVAASMSPASYGFDRMYFDIKDSIDKLVRTYAGLNPLSRVEARKRTRAGVAPAELLATLESAIEILATRTQPDNPVKKFNALVRDTLITLFGSASRDDNFDRDRDFDRDAVLGEVRKKALGVAEEMRGGLAHLVSAKPLVAHAFCAASAYCIAAAAAANEEQSMENYQDYMKAISELSNIAISFWQQGLAACRLGSELREVGARLGASGDIDEDGAKLLNDLYEFLCREAEEARGIPCSEMA
jgi:hypothetical protein